MLCVRYNADKQPKTLGRVSRVKKRVGRKKKKGKKTERNANRVQNVISVTLSVATNRKTQRSDNVTGNRVFVDFFGAQPGPQYIVVWVFMVT